MDSELLLFALLNISAHLENMYPAKLPKRNNLGLANTIFKEYLEADDYLEFIVSIEQADINVKELSSYLDLIYRFDGLTSSIGYSSYVHYPDAQIKIHEVRIGSWELVFQELLKTIDAERLVIICFALRYLPKLILDTPAKALDLLNKWEDYLDKRTRRKFRNSIRRLVDSDEELNGLDKKKRKMLVDLLDELYMRNGKRIIPASRFAIKSVKSLKIITKKKR